MKSYFGGIGEFGKHGFPTKNRSYTDAIKTTDELAIQISLYGMRETQSV